MSAIEFSLGFDLSRLQSGVAQAQALIDRAVGTMSAKSAAVFGFMSQAGGAAFDKIADAARGVRESIGTVFSLSGNLTDLSAQTGIAVSALFVLREAFNSAGVAMDKLPPSVARMQKQIASGSKALKELGIDVNSLQGMAPEQQFLRIGKAIGEIKDPADRAKAAMGVFGKSGAELLSLFTDGGALEKTGATFGKQAAVLAQSAARFDELDDRLERLGKATLGFSLGVAESLLSTINGALSRFEGTDLIGIGRKFGDAIARGVVWLSKGIYYARAIQHAIVAGLLEGAAQSVELGNSLWEGVQRASAALHSGFLVALGLGKQLVAAQLELPMTLAERTLTGLQWAYGQAREFFANGMFDVIGNIAGAFRFALSSAISGMVSVLPAKLREVMGIEKFEVPSLAHFQQAGRAETESLKSNQKGESLNAIAARNRQLFSGFAPGLRAFSSGLRASAEGDFRQAKDVSSAKIGSAFDPAIAGALRDKAAEMATAGLVLWSRGATTKGLAQTMAPAAAKAGKVDQPQRGLFIWGAQRMPMVTRDLGVRGFDATAGGFRNLALGDTRTAGGLLRGSNLSLTGGAHGHVRNGQARAERDWIKAQQAATAEKAKNTEGTNQRLDRSNDILSDIKDALD